MLQQRIKYPNVNGRHVDSVKEFALKVAREVGSYNRGNGMDEQIHEIHQRPAEHTTRDYPLREWTDNVITEEVLADL